MTLEELIKKAEDTGFSHVGPVNMDALEFLPAVRDMCADGKCGAYNKKWSCPPACGTLEECAEKVKGYTAGILVQTTAELEDSFDFEGMAEAGKKHGQLFMQLHKELTDAGEKCYFMGTGGCTLCKECTYPDAPCRHPEIMVSSMEANGLLVSDVCQKSGLPYYYGKDTLTYTAMVLI